MSPLPCEILLSLTTCLTPALIAGAGGACDGAGETQLCLERDTQPWELVLQEGRAQQFMDVAPHLPVHQQCCSQRDWQHKMHCS